MFIKLLINFFNCNTVIFHAILHLHNNNTVFEISFLVFNIKKSLKIFDFLNGKLKFN